MFRPGSAGAKQNYDSSDSGSEWDTTEFGSPYPSRHDDVSVAAPPVSNRSVPESPNPTPRIRVTEPELEKDGTGDGAPGSAYEEETQPPRKNAGKLGGSSSNLSLSAGSLHESGSRNPSPVPPYTSGFREALRSTGSDDISKGEPPSPSRRDHQTSKYEPAPSPRRHIPVDAKAIPNWDDSDAEEQTLREVHTTFKKEKTREIETESARRQFKDEGNQSPTSGPSTSVLEKWMLAQEEKKQKNAREYSKSQQGVSLPPHWSKGDNFAIPAGGSESFIVRDGEGRRFLYFFNEGNRSFYEVEEESDSTITSSIAEKVQKIIQRGLREFFGVLRIIVSVAIFLVIEATNFLTNHVARPLFLAVIITIGNHLLKPVLAGMFSLILQPFFVFVWNVLSGVRDAFRPLSDILGSVVEKLAILLRAFRLVEVNSGRHRGDEYWETRVVGTGRGAIGGDGEVV